MTRAATTAELAILRSDGLAARLYAVIDQPVAVYQCQVNQSFETHDKVAEVTYDNASGTLANALPGMTVLVGSTAGAHDRGLARLRKTPTSSVLYLGEGSEIEWADDLYLTVLDEFSIWPRHVRVTAAGDVYMDYDTAYSDQHSACTPVPCLGPDRALKLSGASVAAQFDASDSWVVGSTISSYAWAVLRGSATLTDANTATPTLTATAAGRILLRCLVTAANGKSFYGYRNVYVYDDANPPTEIVLEDFSGSFERGGFEFSFSLTGPLSFSLRDYLKVVLFAEEQPQSIGPLAGAENVLAIGWLDESECQVNAQEGTARLTAKGAHYWLQRISGYPSGLESTSTTPAAWTQMGSLTVDKMLWHLLHWRSSITYCADIFLTGDDRQASALQAPLGSLWSQIKVIAEESILAAPLCDPYSRLWVQVDANYLPESERSGIPDIMTLSSDDFSSVDFSYRPVAEAARLELSGVAISTGGSAQALFSLAPGHVFGRYGQPLRRESLLLSDQDQANELAGLVLGREQRRFDFSIALVSANRLITLAPRQFLNLSIADDDTPAGAAYTGAILPREMTLTHNPSTGLLQMQITAEPETFATPAVDGDVPANDEETEPWTPTPFVPPPLPAPVPWTPSTEESPHHCLFLSTNGLFWTDSFHLSSPVWTALNDGFAAEDFNYFRYLDMSQSGYYVIGTKKKLYHGMAGSSAYYLAGAEYFDPIFETAPYYEAAGGYHIVGLGCNPLSAGSLAVVCNVPYPSKVCKIFVGSGLVEGYDFSDPLAYTQGRGGISWGRNGILYTYPHGVSYQQRIMRFLFDGSDVGYEDDFDVSSGGAVPAYHFHYWGIDKFISASLGIDENSILFTGDGETQTVLTRKIQACGFDESALNVLAYTQTGDGKEKSADGGITWTAVTAYPGSGYASAIWPCGGAKYVWASGRFYSSDKPYVYYSDDFGASFQNKTGNLHDVGVDIDFQFIPLGLRAMA